MSQRWNVGGREPRRAADIGLPEAGAPEGRPARSTSTVGRFWRRNRAEGPAALPGRSQPSGTNVALLVGGGMVAIMLALALFAPWLGLPDPMVETKFLVDDAGGYHWAPFDPGEVDGHPLGTDFDGRDVLSRLIWGLRPTLLLALLTAAGRIVLGTLAGVLGGWWSGWRGRALSTLMQVASTVPLLVVAIAMLYIAGGGMQVAHFVLALGVTGWAGVAFLVAARVRGQKSAAYIEAARALGASNPFILRRHVLPHLRSLLPVLAAFEMAATLLVLGELGFLGFYLGGGDTRGVARSDSSGAWQITIAGRPELGQMLSAGWENFFQAKWLALWAGLAFVLAVTAFMLLGEGLRRWAEER